LRIEQEFDQAPNQEGKRQMDENTAEGAVTEGAVTEGVGKLKDAAGGLTGDTGTQAEGKFDQLSGKAQRQFGDTIDEAQDQLETVVTTIRDHPLAAVGIAAGAGFLLALLLTPSRQH
jgi:uncharacterized protein YjbJ (UPF0337 family)